MGGTCEEVAGLIYEAAENRLGFKGDVVLTLIIFCEAMSFSEKRVGIRA